MKESRIFIHIGASDMSDEEIYVQQYFNINCKPEWLLSDYGRKVVKEIDGAEVLGGYAIRTRALGGAAPQYLSDGAKALLSAYNNRDKVYPLGKLGDNCAEMLYVGALDGPTHWAYEGYAPKWNPDQIATIVGKGVTLRGMDISHWLVKNVPLWEYDPVQWDGYCQNMCEIGKEVNPYVQNS